MSHGSEGSVKAIDDRGADAVLHGNLHRLAAGRDAINAVEARLQERFPSAQWVFFEPDTR